MFVHWDGCDLEFFFFVFDFDFIFFVKSCDLQKFFDFRKLFPAFHLYVLTRTLLAFVCLCWLRVSDFVSPPIKALYFNENGQNEDKTANAITGVQFDCFLGLLEHSVKYNSRSNIQHHHHRHLQTRIKWLLRVRLSFAHHFSIREKFLFCYLLSSMHTIHIYSIIWDVWWQNIVISGFAKWNRWCGAEYLSHRSANHAYWHV